jgi:hypothetical protein
MIRRAPSLSSRFSDSANAGRPLGGFFSFDLSFVLFFDHFSDLFSGHEKAIPEKRPLGKTAYGLPSNFTFTRACPKLTKFWTSSIFVRKGVLRFSCGLDSMKYRSYIKSRMAWKVETTDEYDTWFTGQTEDSQASIRMKVELLTEYGPHLPRPYADTLKGSKLSNLKELRAQTGNHVFRVAFLFDEERKAILLIGGDKKGKEEKWFYRNLIKQAEEIYKAYRRQL